MSDKMALAQNNREAANWAPERGPRTPDRKGVRSFASGTAGATLLMLASPVGRFFLCPKCDVEMVEVVLRGLSVERCEHCGGTFFDDGEVEDLIRKATAGYENSQI